MAAPHETMVGTRTEREQWSDDEPPLLGDDGDAMPKTNPATGGTVGSNQHGHDRGQAETSIMDEMVAIATEAKAAKRRQQEKERSSTKGFGAGLKKGFFSQSKPRQSKTSKSTPGTGRLERLEITESPTKKEEALRIVKGAPSNQSTQDPGTAPFVFPEVQEALKSMNQLDPKEWMNEQFFAKMAKNPKLLLALQNPRFTQAMSELQQNPQAAVLKYQRDPDVSLMLQDFMEFLGNHFEELGKEQETQQKQANPSTATSTTAAPPAIVDLDETRRQAIANMKRSPEEEEQVQKILQNPELLAALSDATLMEQLRGCQQDPRAFQRLMRDPALGPKLRLLIDAKMVAFA